MPQGLDWQALLEALAAGGFLAGNPEDQEEVVAEERDAAANGRMGGPLPPGRLAALAVEHMPPGPAQAGWLQAGTASAGGLDEYELAGMAMASRKLTSWAQAAELAAVAQITARAAAADHRIGVAGDGRPARLCRDALSQVSLALTLNGYAAGALADLAVTLTWRLPDTGAALAAGRIDADRAEAIARATAVLSEDAARVVEARVLPRAGERTAAYLKDRLHHAVIAADPRGAERRRLAAERHADVRLRGDDDQTASLVADKLPQIHTAAGYARLTAMARARKAAGLPGSLGFHRAQVLVGMMLGTLGWIPPADGAPPDQPPPDDDPGTPPGPGNTDPSEDPRPGDTGPGAGPGRHDTRPGAGPRPGDTGPGAGPRGGGAEDSTPGHGDGGPAGHGQPATPAGPGDDAPPDHAPREDTPTDGAPPDHAPQDHAPPEDAPRDHAPREDAPREDGSWDGRPAPRDEDAPEDDGLDEQGQPGDGTGYDPAEEDPDDLATGKRSGTRPAPQWPELGTIPPALARPGQPAGTNPGQPGNRPMEDRWPGSGLLEISLPWTVLAGLSDEPGILGRIGPITPVQARHLAHAAAHDPAAQWRIIITNDAGQAIAVTRIRRRTRDGPAPPGHHRTRQRPPPPAGLAGRVTLTITQDTLAAITGTGPPTGTGVGPTGATGTDMPTGTGPVGEITAAALRAAVIALEQALAQAAEDAAAGGCAHGAESTAYRPPPRLRDFIAARDLTCRFPTCRMPAWRGDLDHTIPWDQGGRTCPCNLGGGCRGHHQLKQHPRWRLEQTRPGEFTWITPAGRRYTVGPDTHLA